MRHALGSFGSGVAVDGSASRDTSSSSKDGRLNTLAHHKRAGDNLILRLSAGSLVTARAACRPDQLVRSGVMGLGHDVGVGGADCLNVRFEVICQDVAFGPANLGLSRVAVAERVVRALDMVGMRAYADRPPHHLSFGQRKRIAPPRR